MTFKCPTISTYQIVVDIVKLDGEMKDDDAIEEGNYEGYVPNFFLLIMKWTSSFCLSCCFVTSYIAFYLWMFGIATVYYLYDIESDDR